MLLFQHVESLSSSISLVLISKLVDEDMLFQLNLRQQELCRLCVTWQAEVRPITCAYPMPASWGPAEEDLVMAAQYEVSESTDMYEHMGQGHDQHTGDEEDNEDFNYGYHEEEEEEDGDLLAAAEAAALTDAYHDIDADPLFGFSGSEGSADVSDESPRKRKHL